MNIKEYNCTLDKVLSFLSKSVKRRIILHLFTCHEKECDVNVLAELLKEKQSNVSKHLSDLNKHLIIEAKQEGLYRFYYLNPIFTKKYHSLLEEIHKIDNESIDCECVNDGHLNNNG